MLFCLLILLDSPLSYLWLSAPSLLVPTEDVRFQKQFTNTKFQYSPSKLSNFLKQLITVVLYKRYSNSIVHFLGTVLSGGFIHIWFFRAVVLSLFHVKDAKIDTHQVTDSNLIRYRHRDIQILVVR